MSKSLLDRIPPQATQAEYAILGCMLYEIDKSQGVFNMLEPKHFYNIREQKTFEVIKELWETSGAVDPVLVYEYVKRKKITALLNIAITSMEYAERYSIASLWRHYAGEVKRAYLQREIEKSVLVFADKGDSEKLLGDIEEYHKELALIEADSRKNLKDFALETWKEIAQPSDPICIGFECIDKYSAPLRTDLFVMGARPQVGKSILTINILRNLLRQNYKCLVYTTEMTPAQYIKRQVALHAQVSYNKMKYGRLSDQEKSTVFNFLESFSVKENEKLFYSNNPRPSIVDIAADMDAYSPDVVIIDNLSGIKLDGKLDRKTERIEDFVDDLKGLLIKHNTLGILVCHLNRGADDEKMPSMKNIKDSSSVEQKASQCLLLWPKEEDETRKDINFIMDKDRDGYGRAGVLRMDRRTLEFYEVPEDSLL